MDPGHVPPPLADGEGIFRKAKAVLVRTSLWRAALIAAPSNQDK